MRSRHGCGAMSTCTTWRSGAASGLCPVLCATQRQACGMTDWQHWCSVYVFQEQDNVGGDRVLTYADVWSEIDAQSLIINKYNMRCEYISAYVQKDFKHHSDLLQEGIPPE